MSFRCCVWYQLVESRVCVSSGCSAEADVNAGQNSCSSKRKRRRLDVATDCPTARDLFVTVACCWYLASVAIRFDDVSGATSFGLVATLRFEVATGTSREKRCIVLFLRLDTQQLVVRIAYPVRRLLNKLVRRRFENQPLVCFAICFSVVGEISSWFLRLLVSWYLLQIFPSSVFFVSNPRALFSRELFRRISVVSGGCFARVRLLPESSGFPCGNQRVLTVAQKYKITSGIPMVTSVVRPPQSRPHYQILSTERKQCHMDRGFLRKAQPDLHPAVHVSRHRRSKCSATRIVIFCRIMDITSGPNVSHTYSYTTLGPENRAVHSRPRRTPAARESPEDQAIHYTRPTLLSSGCFPRTLYQDQVLTEASLPVRGYFPRTMSRRERILPGYVFPYLENPGMIRLSLFMQQDPRRSWRRYWPPEISAEICSSQPPSPSINTRYQARRSAFHLPAPRRPTWYLTNRARSPDVVVALG
ncbi:hypothetical protein F511_32942 [Dorcoceras hygrometricum]|uniref:Uncharacterized protein n=1 Tax=Dorcoceras hygrometricum TaxID=472368 RepID=A0A2Z7BWN9_9LAMI|nr:hypothetical protein F511_32942 [Dorcoceras hygrometricum]